MAHKSKRRDRRARTPSGQFRKNPSRRSKSRARGGIVTRSAKKRHHKYGAFRYNARKRRRGFRRNPSTSPRGIVGQLMAAGRDAAIIVVAKAATNKIAGLIPFGGTSTAVTAAKQAGVGLALSFGTRKFAPRWAHQVLVGALIAPVETVAKSLPVIGPALKGYPIHGAGAGMAKYLLPNGQPGGVGAYVPWPNGGRAGGVSSYQNIQARRAAYYGS